MPTRIPGLLLSVRNCHASVKMATELTRCSGGQRGGNCWPCSEENISSVCSLYLRWGGSIICRVTGNRIQTLLWGFSARPSLSLSISNCSVLLVLESKF